MPRIFRFRNIYFGSDSLVKLIPNKKYLENYTDYDVTTLAFLLDVSDFTNKNALLSHYAIIDKNIFKPILIEWNLKTINGRVMVLKNLKGPRDTKALIFKFGSYVENNYRPEIIKIAAYQYAMALANTKGLHNIYNFLIQRIAYLKSIGIKKSLEEVKRLEMIYR
jgi:hypothetical protein